jgi:hypothetical protein
MELEKMAGDFSCPFSPHWKRGFRRVAGLQAPRCNLNYGASGFAREIMAAVPKARRGNRKPAGRPDPTDAEVRTILVQAMADVGADPALVYAFQKTGVYICDENEKRLPKDKLKAFDGAVDEYFDALKRPRQ